jgi:hypothetical protein
MTKLNLYTLKTINMHSQDILLQYDNKCITMDFNTNFLGTILGHTLHWGKYIDTRSMREEKRRRRRWSRRNRRR